MSEQQTGEAQAQREQGFINELVDNVVVASAPGPGQFVTALLVDDAGVVHVPVVATIESFPAEQYLGEQSEAKPASDTPTFIDREIETAKAAAGLVETERQRAGFAQTVLRSKIPDHVLESGKPLARIEHWSLFGNVLIGEVFDHPRQHEFEEYIRRTSALVRISVAGGYAETKNTIYVLGTPA